MPAEPQFGFPSAQGMSTVVVEEPRNVYPEVEFEAALTRAVGVILGATQAAVVPKFGLDIGMFFSAQTGSRAAFIEAKSYGAQRQGGVGFGNGRGEGPQVNLLLCDTAQLSALDAHVRWAFVDATKPLGSARYALVTCTEARSLVMDVVARGKQNNFRMAAITPHFIPWPTFCGALVRFLGVANTAV